MSKIPFLIDLHFFLYKSPPIQQDHKLFRYKDHCYPSLTAPSVYGTILSTWQTLTPYWSICLFELFCVGFYERVFLYFSNACEIYEYL